jgi:hypothetical protein
MKSHRRVLVSFSFMACLTLISSAAFAQGYTSGPIEGPNLAGMDRATMKTRAISAQKARSQRFTPAFRQEAAARLGQMDIASAQFKQEIATMPVQVKAAVFQQKATEAGLFTDLHDRRLRGMLKSGAQNNVTHTSKKFVEVTPQSFDLFRQTMGKNVVWFAVTESPGHLHTLLADQAEGQRMHHNVYGTNTDQGIINAYNNQIAMGVQLSDVEMDRFVRYTNAGMANNGWDATTNLDKKLTVFGFYNRQKQKVTDMKCTNWATTAPIGDLPRWVSTLDKRLEAMSATGQLTTVPEIAEAGGLHAALARAGSVEARAELVTRVLATPMTRWNRQAVKRLAKSFNKILADFPNRPADLVLRTSLAQTLDLNRSQDPAKWSYDLLMSKRVPVVALLNSNHSDQNAQRTLNWEIMGQIAPDGKVIPGNYSGANANGGVIPPAAPAAAPAPEAQPAPTAAQ